ncbi:hypothetical protein JK628_16365 [Shewanella sp. KX20019]|uniref:hypothetical protein n=1 Tax=Shewanella sp. KX20019 TaxID=2803864 RepID=UPI0019283C24|nr:hypothetical protein [Shewanella sp. KX20019]QQX79120.1 hypothetical protein JK628_16365 [Shewanella sp. KX20019]
MEASKHYDDALVYALWGVEHYDSTGLNTYLALISDDHFDGSLTARLLISNSSDKVTQRYNELSQWIRSEQQKLGIELQSPPKAAINDFALQFALQLALQKSMNPELVSWISELEVSENNRFNSTPCIDELLTSMTAN